MVGESMKESRGNTHQYRKRIVKNARKGIQKIIREYLDEWIENYNNPNYHLEPEEINMIQGSLNNADDVLKEMERDLE